MRNAVCSKMIFYSKRVRLEFVQVYYFSSKAALKQPSSFILRLIQGADGYTSASKFLF